MDLVQLGGQVDGTTGPRFWRSLDEYSRTPEFRAMLRDEFPSQLETWSDPVGRRHFLKLMGASMALAGAAGCAYQPPEKIVPYVKAPDDYVPGKPVFYATALSLGGFATGVLVESNDHRPTKVEGNPDHPASLGATDAFCQAELLQMYDPDRSKVVLLNGRVSTWESFLEEWVKLRSTKLAEKGKGVRLLTQTITSPTLASLFDQFLKAMPEARWVQYEPVGREATRAGTVLAFGEPVDAVHHLDKADVIAAFDADFLAWGPSRLTDARHWAQRRDPGPGPAPKDWKCNRLYCVETMPSITGAMADHRLATKPSGVPALLRSLAAKLGVNAGGKAADKQEAWVDALAKDLQGAAGKSLVLVGETQPAEVHALAHAINQKLGNIGQTVSFIEPVAHHGGPQGGTLAELVKDIEDGSVDTLIMLGGNLVYEAPADLAVIKALDKVRNSVQFSIYEDETTEHCRWHVPLAHTLESWGDIRAFDGSVTIQQPLIQPIYKSKSIVEVMKVLVEGTTTPDRVVVEEYWRARGLGENFEAGWRKALHAGVVPGTASKPKTVTLKEGTFGATAETSVEAGAYELHFRPDPSIWDGSYANNGWLQELPKQITKLTWDNAAIMSPNTAKALGVAMDTMEMVNDVVEVTVGERKLKLPVWIAPGHADESITVHLGYGRTKAGRVGDGAGFNAYTLRTSATPWSAAGAKVRKVAETFRLATTQHFQNIDYDNTGAPLNAERHLVRYDTVERFLKHPEFAQGPDHHLEESSNLYVESPEPRRQNEVEGKGNRWAMAINMNTCIGCNACVVACNAENNIPVIGKNQVLRGRNMHWLRIDRYYENDPGKDPSKVKTHFQPVPCMQCEKAPCEVVCPFAATVHDSEGINTMVYNRCAGTKFCSNNCPYKVRRFNYFYYNDYDSESLMLMRNPDVSVRTRGVMEKCTYCVQRLWSAKIHAEKKRGDTKVLDGEVVTACQGACPTRAITFGNWNDNQSDIAKAKKGPRNYALLAELNTLPRTTYLAKLTNPNPAMKES